MSSRPDPGEAAPASRPPAPTRREVVEGLAAELEAGGVPAARVEAERLLAHVLELERSDLSLHPDVAIEPAAAGLLAASVKSRLSGVPLQHIEGTVAFRDLVLVCDRRALIPRPETEELVQCVVDWAHRRSDSTRRAGSHDHSGVRPVRRPAVDVEPPLGLALDIGTGSGAIALSLVHENVAGRVVAVDVSASALQQARENASRVGLAGRVEFRETAGSPWDAVREEENFDLVVSNPPYVADHEIAGLPSEVRDHDPREALAGGSDGLAVTREIISGAWRHVRSGGALFLEVGEGQAEAVEAGLSRTGRWSSVRRSRDLADRERFVIAER